MKALAVKALVMRRPGTLPLHFPDFSITPGDQILMLGASGCGKTTLLSIIAGLLRPSAGRVLIDGQDFFAMNTRQRDHIRGRDFGFVFQNLHLLPSLTLAQNIALAADMAGLPVDQKRLADVMGMLGLADKARCRPHALSQGEQQRAAIARAVFNRPSVILADEPTSALDDRNAHAVIDLILEQAENTKAALVIATHDTRIISRLKTVINLDTMMKEAA